MFMRAYGLPKLRWLWGKTDLTGSKAQWLMDLTNFLAQAFEVFFAASVVTFVFLEIRGKKSWPQYRSTIVSIVAVSFHTAILLSVAAMAVGALLAAPLMMRK